MPVAARTDYGEAIRDGVIHHLSASSISKADPSQYGGCFRRWLYHYVLKIKEPQTKAQAIGVETHDCAERYYKGIDDGLNPLLLAARHFMPPRHPLIEAEHEIPFGSLLIEGVPIVGLIDILNPTGETQDEQGELIKDPANVIEVLDWKTSKDVLAYAKKSHELIYTNQMALYAAYVMQRSNEKFTARISHVYMQTRGRMASAKATMVAQPEVVHDRWTQMSQVARTLKDIVKETDPLKVPANRRACTAWRGCPQKDRCPVDKSQTLIDIFGVSKAGSIKGEKIMSLKDEMQNLKNEQQQVGNVTMQETVTDEQFKTAWETILGTQRGVPPLNEDAGACLARVYNYTDYTGRGYGGQGDYAGLRPLAVQDVLQLAHNLSVVAVPASAPAPVPTPEAATINTSPLDQTIVTAPPPVSALEPTVTVQQETAEVTEPPDVVLAREYVKKAKWTGQKMDKKQLSDVIRYLFDNQSPQAPGSVRTVEKIVEKVVEVPAKGVAPAGNQLTVYIDCIPSCPADTLDPYINRLLRELEKQCNAKDIRCSNNDVLSFGKWKGTLAAMVREMPPEPGTYTIDTQSEIHAVVAGELRGMANVFVKGIK